MSRNNQRRHSKHCHLCGSRLWGGGWVYVPNGESEQQAIVVCGRCQATALRCAVCGVPVGSRRVQLPDGRCICLRCGQTAIYDPARAWALFERVVRVVTDQLGLALNVGADFALVDPQHLRRLAQEVQPLPHGETDQIVGLFVRKGRRRMMYLLSGLPQILFIQTVAHEWAHAWQGESCPLLRDPIVREGFAEWVAYKALQALGATKKTALMKEREGLYGDGLRKMLHLEETHGISGVLAFCRRSE